MKRNFSMKNLENKHKMSSPSTQALVLHLFIGMYKVVQVSLHVIISIPSIENIFF